MEAYEKHYDWGWFCANVEDETFKTVSSPYYMKEGYIYANNRDATPSIMHRLI